MEPLEEIRELQALAVELTGKPLEQILSVKLRGEGLGVVVWPGPKYVFTPEQVEDARRAVEHARRGRESARLQLEQAEGGAERAQHLRASASASRAKPAVRSGSNSRTSPQARRKRGPAE
jgi:hypothetical protein